MRWQYKMLPVVFLIVPVMVSVAQIGVVGSPMGAADFGGVSGGGMDGGTALGEPEFGSNTNTYSLLGEAASELNKGFKIIEDEKPRRPERQVFVRPKNSLL